MVKEGKTRNKLHAHIDINKHDGAQERLNSRFINLISTIQNWAFELTISQWKLQVE